MTEYEQRLIEALEGIEKELQGIRAAMESREDVNIASRLIGEINTQVDNELNEELNEFKKNAKNLEWLMDSHIRHQEKFNTFTSIVIFIYSICILVEILK